MNETIELTGADRATYDRAVRKMNDPSAKPLTEKEHDVYDRVHGDRASITDATTTQGAALKSDAERLRDAARASQAPDGMTDAERNRIAAEANARIADEDPALVERGAGGAAGMSVPIDTYEMDERGTTAESVAASRRAQHVDERTSPGAEDLAEHGVWTNPAPFDAPRPSAPLPGDVDAPIGMVVDADRRTSTRPQVDSIELAQEFDELDQLMGSSRRRSQATFDFLRDEIMNHRHVFSRHYFDKGVLVDRFSDTSARVSLEVADKIRRITAYNATVAPREQLGYLAYVAGVDLGYDDVQPALERKIATRIIAPAEKGAGEALEPGVIHDTSSLQVRPAKGFARILERPIAMKDGRTPMAVYYHDAMAGIYQVHVDGIVAEARNRDEAEAIARAKVETTA